MYKNNYSVKNSLKKLFLQRYERYLPTAFDESMSLLEKMNKLIETQNALIDVINAHKEHTSEQIERAFDIIDTNLEFQLKAFRDELEEQKTLYEEIRDKIHSDLLPDTVHQKLEEWLLDGTIEDMLIGTAFPVFNEKLEALENRVESLDVSVKDFGAMGDGKEVSSEIQEAVDFVSSRGGGRVFIPAGEYGIQNEILVPSNMTIEGAGESTVLNRVSPLSTIFRVRGEIGNEIGLTQNATRGDMEVNVANASGFKKGDYFKIISQRDAQHADAGKWRMGNSTANTNPVYLGEVQNVTSVSGNKLAIGSGLLFPDYLTHDYNETSPNARKSSTIQKIDYVSNVRIGKFKATGRLLHVIHAKYARHCEFYDYTYENAPIGAILTMSESLHCVGRNLKAFYDPSIVPDNYYNLNTFKTLSCQNCGFDQCLAYHGGQTFDFTYNTFDTTTPDLYSYFTNGRTMFAQYNAGTAHGGTYGSQIINNQFLFNKSAGLGVRAREAVVSNNIVSGSGLRYGIAFFDGSAIDGIISDNQIKGFETAVDIADGRNNQYGYVGINIIGNIITDVDTGVSLRRPYAYTPKDVIASIRIANNIFSNFRNEIDGNGLNYGVHIARHWRGVDIDNNTFVGTGDNSRQIRLSNEVWDVNIRGNTFRNGNENALYFYPVTDTKTYNYVKHPNYLSPDNQFDVKPSRYRLSQADWRSHDFNENITPTETDARVYLGTSNRRFYTASLQVEPSVSSDASVKENVLPLNNALNIIKELNPVSYNRIEENGTHYGLIAQEVEKTFKNNGIDTSELSLIEVDEEGQYSLKNGELIPLLIKAIQDLNNRIK